MTNHTLKTFALSLVHACMAGLIIQACGGLTLHCDFQRNWSS